MIKMLPIKVVDHEGNEYESVRAMCKVYGIKRWTYNKRRKNGMSLKDALTTPVRTYIHSGKYEGMYKFQKKYKKGDQNVSNMWT